MFQGSRWHWAAETEAHIDRPWWLDSTEGNDADEQIGKGCQLLVFQSEFRVGHNFPFGYSEWKWFRMVFIFRMQQLLTRNVRSIILTSGTLAPLKPLISELGIPVSVRLENPHIVTSSQVCVKVVSHGPDKEPLLSNFDNRFVVIRVFILGNIFLYSSQIHFQ